MTTEVGQPIQLVAPISGAVLTLDAPLEELACFLAEVSELQSVVRERQKLVRQEVISRMDKAAKWTAHAGAYKLTTSSPAPTEEFDGAELRTRLLELADEGLLTIEAVDAAVEQVITWKPRKSGINALRKLGGKPAAAVDELCRPVVKERYVRVERS